MHSIFITIRKELRSMFRDKKTFYTLLVFPILIPVMIFMYSYMYENESEEQMYSIGINYELSAVEASLFENANLEGVSFSTLDEMKDAYLQGKILGYIDYHEEEQKYIFYTNVDSEDGMYVSNYVQSYLDGYREYLVQLYLIGEDIDVVQVYNQISYEVVDLEGENWILKLMFTIAFTYIIMSIVMSTTNMATTATAVEKENGTLETILTFPIRSSDLIIGKYLATVFMGMLASLIGLGLTLGSLVIATNSFSVFEGITFSISMTNVLVAIFVVICASLFIAGLSIAVTSFAKSYKEAQSMSSVLNLLTIIPMMISMLGLSIHQIYYFIPIFNYTQILMDLFSYGCDLISLCIVIFSSIVYVVIVISYIIHQYHSDRVLFGVE